MPPYTRRFFEFLDRRHQPHRELEVGFDRGPTLRALSVITRPKNRDQAEPWLKT
jgi:hypothetical protein